MANVVMKAPSGNVSSYVSLPDGTNAAISSAGYVTIPDKFVTHLLNGGFMPTYLVTTKYTDFASGSATMAAGVMEGAEICVIDCSGQTAAVALTTRTAAQIIAGVPNATVGMSWIFRIMNRNTSSGAVTLTAGDVNVTLSDSAVVAIATTVDFIVTVATATTVTVQRASV